MPRDPHILNVKSLPVACWIPRVADSQMEFSTGDVDCRVSMKSGQKGCSSRQKVRTLGQWSQLWSPAETSVACADCEKQVHPVTYMGDVD